MPSEDIQSSLFPKTRWTDLGRAAGSDMEELDRLIRLYWQPLKVFLVSSFPGLGGRAEIYLQEFAEDKMIKEGWLRRADPSRGRFRDFLKTSLRNFVRDKLSRSDVKNAPVSLEEFPQDPTAAEPPAEQFDLMWVKTVLAEAVKRMEADCRDPEAEQPRRTYIWDMFRVRLLDPIFTDAEPTPYDQLIGRFELKSPTDASNLLLSGKRIFKAHLHAVIAEYAGKDAATRAEIQALEDFVSSLSRT